MTAERWRPIPGYPGYEASTEGRVRSKNGVLRAAATNRGALIVCASIGGITRSLTVARAVFYAFHGIPSVEGQIGRFTGGQTDNRPENLYWKPRR